MGERERGRKLTCIKFQLSIKLMPKTDVRDQITYRIYNLFSADI